MGHATETETHKAAKAHMCEWCWTRVEKGETYKRYRWFDCGDAGTVRMHPECLEACEELVPAGGEIEIYPGENPRGCNCGGWADCPRCHPESTKATA